MSGLSVASVYFDRLGLQEIRSKQLKVIDILLHHICVNGLLDNVNSDMVKFANAKDVDTADILAAAVHRELILLSDDEASVKLWSTIFPYIVNLTTIEVLEFNKDEFKSIINVNGLSRQALYKGISKVTENINSVLNGKYITITINADIVYIILSTSIDSSEVTKFARSIDYVLPFNLVDVVCS